MSCSFISLEKCLQRFGNNTSLDPFFPVEESPLQNFRLTKSKPEKLRNRAKRIISGHTDKVHLPSINHVRNKQCAIEVFKCLHGLAPRIFEKHFERLDHQKDTRKQVKSFGATHRTETARKAFSY